MSWDANGSPVESAIDLAKETRELEGKLREKFGGKWTMCHNIDEILSKVERAKKILRDALEELE